MAKIKFNVKVDVYENGYGVIIKQGTKQIGARVFLNGQEKEFKEWMERTKSDAIANSTKK